MSKKNIFVIGLDDFNLKQIETIRNIQEYEIHGLLPLGMLLKTKNFNINRLIEKGLKEIEESGVKPDAFISHWDFPSAALVAVFRKEYNLPGPSLDSILIAEHKYWCRLRHEKSIPENIPEFESINPFDEEAVEKVTLEFPFWIKPNIGFSSQMVYFVKNKQELKEALAETRKKIARFGDPFAEFLKRVDMPEDIPTKIDAYHCILEKPIGGRQCTVEGYIKDDECHIFGVVDSLREGRMNSSFARYILPSQLPDEVKSRLKSISKKAIYQMGLDDVPFNIEYFWDEESDNIWLLEVNTRISKSHSPLFADIMGASNHEVAVELALGKEPDYPRDEGPHDVSIKFMMRFFEDGVVKRVPTKSEILDLEHEFECSIQIEVSQGERLSEMPDQDSYSYEVAVVFMGGKSRDELEQKYAELKDRLPLEIEER
ncbi:MAG: ATP-grasp domain-containing protein [Campylobacterales bacterium]